MRKLLCAAMLASAATQPCAPAAADFPQKNIEFIIPFGHGGGCDRTVRAIAPFMEKQLGGTISVLPRNVPGAGGKRGMATLYRAKPDGYTIAIANIPGSAIPALNGEAVEYDIDKLTWIARLATEEYILAVQAKSAIRSIEDLRKLGRPVKMP